MNFVSRDNKSILTVSARTGIHQIDLNSSQIIKSFFAQNFTFDYPYANTLYSKDFSYLYGLSKPQNSAGFAIQIWTNNNETKNPIREIKLPDTNWMYGPMTNLKESDSAMI
jgi:hypothetical protein